jgi:hypothetical protein
MRLAFRLHRLGLCVRNGEGDGESGASMNSQHLGFTRFCVEAYNTVRIRWQRVDPQARTLR